MDYDSTPSPAALAKRYQDLFWNLPPSQPRRKPVLARFFKLPGFVRRLVRRNPKVRRSPKPRFV